jgi:hypothetical protein
MALPANRQPATPPPHSAPRALPILFWALFGATLTEHGYILPYQPEREASGRISHFYATLRPKRYVEDGIRSYYMDDSGVIHATSEDRPATSTDPEAFPCELGEVCLDASAP